MSLDASSSPSNPLNRDLAQPFQPVDPELSAANAALETSRQQVLALKQQLAHEIAERKRAERALKESEDRHRLVADRLHSD
jgi:PAS domain-containing protein